MFQEKHGWLGDALDASDEVRQSDNVLYRPPADEPAQYPRISDIAALSYGHAGDVQL